jgi:hypothetical protein
MTFELPGEARAARDRARTFAAGTILPQVDAIDRKAAIPQALVDEAATLIPPADQVALVAVVEELAAASGAVALAAALPARSREPLGLAGLCGAMAIDDSPRAQLVLAAVTLGLGRASLDRSTAARFSSAWPVTSRLSCSFTAPRSGSGRWRQRGCCRSRLRHEVQGSRSRVQNTLNSTLNFELGTSRASARRYLIPRVLDRLLDSGARRL